MTADPVAEACTALAGYMDTLELLVAEPSTPGVASPAARSRAASVPEPYGEAGQVLMTAHEDIRRLLALVRHAVTGRRGEPLGGSDEVTAYVFRALPKLAAGRLSKEQVSDIVRRLDSHTGRARSVHGIDENRRWQHLPGQDDGDGLPPKCPYCQCMFLLYDPDAGVIACSVPGCEDSEGQSPAATIGTDDSGVPALWWADGKVEKVPDLEAVQDDEAEAADGAGPDEPAAAGAAAAEPGAPDRAAASG